MTYLIDNILFPILQLQRQHADGQRCDAGVLGGSGGTPGGAQVSRAGGGRVAVRPSTRRNGTHTRGLADGLPRLSQMDGECKIECR